MAVWCVAAIVSAFALSLPTVTGQTAIEQRIARVEGHLLPGVVVKGGPEQALAMADRMRVHDTPGVSVAVVNDGGIEWARAYGVLEAGTSERATPRTRFQAASISKPVTAMAALRLAQDGRLSLDVARRPFPDSSCATPCCSRSTWTTARTNSPCRRW